jgi:hypothetical protein
MSRVGRTLYVRVTEDGKRKYVDVGMLYRRKVRIAVEQYSKLLDLNGMPNPGWWDEE